MTRVIISGGGTGGHIYPAVSIAQEIIKSYPDAEILFVGAKGRMEMQKVPKAGFAIVGLWISGLSRKHIFENVLFPFKVLASLWKSYFIIRRFKPDLAIGVGGYASGPLLYMAGRMGIPTLIHEQNSYAGLTNKWLASKATCICVAYENMEKFFPSSKIVFTGNPVRQDILDIKEKDKMAFSFFELENNRPVILVIGGSLGALSINEGIKASLPEFKKHGYQVLWQTGAGYIEKYKELAEPGIVIYDFIFEMNLAYTVADIVISRAGASSIAEIAIVGKPSILIPSPWVAEDHQTQNAKALFDKGAAMMLSDLQVKQGQLAGMVHQLLNSNESQEVIKENLKLFAVSDARNRIMNQIKKLLHGKIST